jgi:hypothetical protein
MYNVKSTIQADGGPVAAWEKGIFNEPNDLVAGVEDFGSCSQDRLRKYETTKDNKREDKPWRKPFHAFHFITSFDEIIQRYCLDYMALFPRMHTSDIGTF